MSTVLRDETSGRDEATGLGWRCWGDPARPAVVCLHGFLGTGEDWAPLADSLGDSLRLFAVDLPGHGASEGVDETLFDIVPLTRALSEVVHGHGFRRPALLGYSLGARLALHCAVRMPGMWSSLILESGTAGLEDPAERAARRSLDAARAEELRSRPLETFVDEWYRQPLFRSLADRPDVLAALVRRRAGEVNPAGAARAVVAYSPGRLSPLWARLEEIEMPVHCIAGERDERYVALGRRIAEGVRRGRLHTVPGAGHNVHLEEPAAFGHIMRTR